MINYDDLTVVLPVRLGSSRIKEKILLPFYKEFNLLEWKISQLKAVSHKLKIVVSSNSDLIQEIALKNGVNYHHRENYLSVGHQASFSEVITGVVNKIQTNHFAWVTVVVPLMTPNEYLKAFEAYFINVVEEKRYDSLMAVNLLKEYLWNDNNPINYKANKHHTISQELPNIFRVTNGLYMCDKKATLERGYFLGNNPCKFEVSKISGIDIDEYEDYEISRAMLDIYLSRES